MTEVKEIDLGPVKGPKGDKGDPGERGPEGPVGPQGKDGVVNADTAIAFQQATKRQNIASGEKIGTILGKISKFFADLKTHAFEEPVRNLTTSVVGKALDATMGKKLKEEVDALNSALDEKFKYFKTYSIFDTNSNNTDENYQYPVKYYLQESDKVGNGMFIVNMNLKYGSAYVINGYKSDRNHITCIILSHNRDMPIYAYCRSGKWTFKILN